MYVVNKVKTLDEYLKELKKGELNKLYNIYKKMFENKILEQEKKETIIRSGIINSFNSLVNTFTDKELEEFQKLIKEEKVQEVSSMFIKNNFLFIKDNEIIIPTDIKVIFENIDIDEISKSNKLSAIDFYLNANGVLSINKLQELLEATDLKITKTELKVYLNELKVKVSKNYVYTNDIAFSLDKELSLSKIKEQSDDYAIYTIDDITEIYENWKETDYIVQIYKNLKKCLRDEKKCFFIASTIYDYIRCGYQLEENIQNVFTSNNLKGTKGEIRKLNKLLQDIYDNTPSWELNGYYPEEKAINLSDEEIGFLLSYINMYMIMNGVIKIDKLFEILINVHHFDITKDELIEFAQIHDDIYIINDYFCAEGISEDILNGLIEQKEKIKKYKIITNLDNFFEEHDNIENKLKKLINKYTDNKTVANQVISLIVIGGINEFTLNVTLKSNKIELPENKVIRMLKDLEICQKNVRIWSLNGYTMNEIKLLKKGINL